MIDAIDKPLVQILGKDALQSSESIARQLDVSAATVRRRIRKLVKDGTLHVVALVDPNKVGLNLAALVALDIPHDKLESVSDQLARQPQVKWVSTMTGKYNVMAFVRAASTEELADFMEKELTRFDGIRSAETVVCLNVKKGRHVQV